MDKYFLRSLHGQFFGADSLLKSAAVNSFNSKGAISRFL